MGPTLLTALILATLSLGSARADQLTAVRAAFVLESKQVAT